jgi:hypothetical protein
MDDYRLTVTFVTAYVDAGHLEEALERLLDALIAQHEDLGPVVDGDTEGMTVGATIAFDVNALDPSEAVEYGSKIIDSAVSSAGVETSEVVDVHLERVRELQPA